MAEEFKVIPGFPDHRVSNTGRVQTRKIRGSKRVGSWRDMGLTDRLGYPNVTLRHNYKVKTFKVHRLVAEPPGNMSISRRSRLDASDT